MSAIIAAFSDSNIIPSLFEGLEQVQSEYGEYDAVSIAALTAGRIQQSQFVKKEPVYPGQDFSSFLEKQSLTACLSLACLRHKKLEPKYHVHLSVTEEMALAYHGLIDNLPDIREDLLQLGYELHSLCSSELILRFIRRYLDIDFSVREASLTAIRRLKGEFAIVALFADQNSLIVAQRGVPMTLGIKGNELYITSNNRANIVQPTMHIEEDSLLILRSSQKINQTFG